MIKQAREWLRHARHCRHMREDVASKETLDQLLKTETDLADAITARDTVKIEKGYEAVHQAMLRVSPAKSYSGLRENLEVVVVAVAVAMAFRAYCLQPFKIPTGSMQPTLYGIHHTPQDGKGIFDVALLQYVKWAATGQWYVEVKALAHGVFRKDTSMFDGRTHYRVDGFDHDIPEGLRLLVQDGDEVVTGQLLATGNRTTGDHLFVNRVKWNFMMPQRGEVMVFRTDNLPIPGERTHYIKRMCGLPTETVTIAPPRLLINGLPVREPEAIRRIADKAPGYAGYTLGGGEYLLDGRRRDSVLATSTQAVTLGTDQYMALGDNTCNSLDSRYWGPVPAANLVGPAMVVYWPFSKRWGWIY